MRKKKKTKKTKVSKKKSPGKIDRIESLNLILFTGIYAIVFGALSGVCLVYVPDLIYIFDIIPIDVQKTVWIGGSALWAVISLLMGLKYKRE